MIYTVIISPHIDDEVIGCYRELRAGGITRVIYCYEYDDPKRAQEALRACARFNVEVMFLPLWALAQSPDALARYSRVLIPSRFDHHPHHRAVTSEVLRILSTLDTPPAVGFYSVDMNVPGCEPLHYDVATAKREALYELFPSQRTYFDQHPQAYLFEDIRDTDTWNSRQLAVPDAWANLFRLNIGGTLYVVPTPGLQIVLAGVAAVFNPRLPEYPIDESFGDTMIPHAPSSLSPQEASGYVVQRILSDVLSLNPGFEARVALPSHHVFSQSAYFPSGAC